MSKLAEVLARLDEIKNPNPHLYEKPVGVGADLIAALEEARDLLREVEWVTDRDDDCDMCPSCRSLRKFAGSDAGMHIPDCKLAEAIGAPRRAK